MRVYISMNTRIPEICTTNAREQAQLGAVFVDVREQGDVQALAFDAPEVLNLPLRQVPLRWHELPSDRELVLVCQDGSRSAEASQLLCARGFQHVSPMRGGILLWMQKGYPVKGKRFEGADAPDPANDFSEKDQ